VYAISVERNQGKISLACPLPLTPSLSQWERGQRPRL
jgi:hypothetical protein